MSGLKVFVDYFSQPCRAVLMLLEANRVPYTPQLIKIAKGENRSEEFKKVSPVCKVPAINDEGFFLCESASIMKYLACKYQLPDHWYPSNQQKRAKIDEYLDWHHENLRMGAARTLFEKVFKPSMFGTEPKEETLKETVAILGKSNKMMETYFLKDTKFIHSDVITIADLQAVCEYTQYWLVSSEAFENKPRISQWIEDCKAELQPHFDAAHKMVYMARDKGTFKGKL